ncbi:sulfatase [Ruminiclostridium cellulolyticum H10]|uniref:Sulfatase n=1 Tax=Ruminiclostridium cellulolyticum (strain ATCC 35319 / DSM 5812 / JCM 6584 / H10) TaxID=394503 RepID=B8I0U1_RUMCH|nr:sulfatase [Ruminiclostridium cellulolyticum H10]
MFNNLFSTFSNAFKNKPYRKAAIVSAIFIILNAFKTSLFNYLLLPKTGVHLFTYKFWISLLVCIIVFSFVLSLKSRYVFLIVYIIQGIYCFTNISYFLYYHSYLHFLQWISLFKEAMISASHFANPISVQLLVVFIDVPVALFIFFKCFKREVKSTRLPLLRNVLIALSVAILIIIEIFNFSNRQSVVQFMNDRYSGETRIVERYGTVANGIVSIVQNNTEEKLIKQINYGKNISSPSNVTASKSTVEQPNYVVIQVESMDSNIVKQKYKGSYIMPYMSSLMNNSVYYPYTLSYHKGGGTSDAEFSVINSAETLDSFPAIKLSSYNYPNSVVSKLAKASYNTMAFHGNVGTFYNRNIAFSKMGFKKFYDINSMNFDDEGWGAPDDKVFSFAFGKIDKSTRPFYAHIITMTSHGPFESARNYYNNKAYDDIENEIVKNFYNSFSYVDESIKDFVEKIQTKYSNTYIIIYGDHTPNISSKDFAQASFIDDGKYFEFVPMFVITPDHKKYVEDSVVASFLDVSPTIMATSKLAYNIKTDGRSLLDTQTTPADIPFKGGSFDRIQLYNKISTHKYVQEEPLWRKYLPSFISSSLIERHK